MIILPTRYGRCAAINLGNGRQCKNKATGNGFCHVSEHQAMYGVGVCTPELPGLEGVPRDMNTPVSDKGATVRYLKAKLANHYPTMEVK